ncbi:hypothetical protein P7K49_012101 [Saguinus oedipus]|uniref:Uncharacterized protein n=1 Tax=Saguinus oedipus TaxID=9490 RepID=A0ABQ9VSJ9_SAGOE|nr:hypothetical protein P7K49_012101 [Saguinus oedipus]
MELILWGNTCELPGHGVHRECSGAPCIREAAAAGEVGCHSGRPKSLECRGVSCPEGREGVNGQSGFGDV